jgi:hypothetical protein
MIRGRFGYGSSREPSLCLRDASRDQNGCADFGLAVQANNLYNEILDIPLGLKGGSED